MTYKRNCPSNYEIQSQLNRVRRSAPFRDAKILSTLLQFIVQKAMSGEDKSLNAKTIARCVFNKGEEFSSRRNPVVRNSMRRLRNALTIYYAIEGKLDDVVLNFEAGCYMPDISYRLPEKEQSPVTKALELTDIYLHLATIESHITAYDNCIKVLEDYPEDIKLLAAFTELSIDSYTHGFGGTVQQIEVARKTVETAMSISNSEPDIWFVKGLLALEDGDLAQVGNCAKRVCELDPENETVVVKGKWLNSLVSKTAKSENASFSVLEEENYPGWLHHPIFLSKYHFEDYEGALSEAIAFGMPQFFWGYLERAAALGQLGLKKAASRELHWALKLNPIFPMEPKRFLSSYIPYQDEMEHVLEGLEKAGLRQLGS